MNKNGLEYEAPKAKIYRFEENDRVLTESGIPTMASEFAANMLNQFMGGINTTKE